MADDSLTQDYGAHLLFTFAQVPDSPILSNRYARLKRWFTIAFAETWLAVWLYRTKVRLRHAHIPFLPGLCDAASRALFDVQIGDRVDAGPGLMLTHGHVVIDGQTRIGSDCQVNPWVTIGLSNSKKLGFSVDGPFIGDHVHIGTGAKVLGPITIGDYARIGANAVVVHDVPPNTTVVGMPAHPIASATLSTAPDGSGRDERLVAHMRSSITDYRLRRQSLRSLVDGLLGSFEIASDRMTVVQANVKDDLIFLDAIAATGGEESPQVLSAVLAIDNALAAFE